MPRRFALILAVGILALASVAAARPAPKPQPAARAATCGVFRWNVKTLSDYWKRKVNYTPLVRSVGFLRNLNGPELLHSDTPRILDSPEVRTYKLHVDLHEATIEADRDIHLVVSAPAHPFRTLIVEFPSTSCKGAAGSYKKARLAASRAAVLNDCGSISSSSFTKLKGSATITGVGYFDTIHGQTGHAPNGIEIHPVLSYAGNCSKPSGGGGGGGCGGGGSCTPGYSPCLVHHGGADYDCYGGRGNGPYYTQPGVTYHGFRPVRPRLGRRRAGLRMTEFLVISAGAPCQGGPFLGTTEGGYPGL